jgi:2-desacetyl-2-hydroxyethyl bacteriochlorophyllide A dehydrogenase
MLAVEEGMRTMNTMKAARFHSPNQPLKLEHVPIPSVGPSDVLVEVKACGVCGSDVHILKGETFTGFSPIILGHEGCGTIKTLGENVSGWNVGDRVVIDCVTTCGNCFHCLGGRDSICLNRKLTGIHLDGALAEYVRVQPRNLIPLPETVSFEHGCLATDAVATPYHALKARARLQACESIAIFGVGGLGIHAVKLARLMGASPVVAVDIAPQALERARVAGADVVIDAREEDPSEAIKKRVGPLGVHVALECVGRAQTVRSAVESVGPGGRVVVVGLGPEKLHLKGITEFVRSETALMGSSAFEIKEIKEILFLIASKRLDVSSSVTRTISLEQVNEALEELAQRPGNVTRIVVNRF